LNLTYKYIEVLFILLLVRSVENQIILPYDKENENYIFYIVNQFYIIHQNVILINISISYIHKQI